MITFSREQEDAIRAVSKWFASKKSHVFVIMGPAGSGKSSLAQHFAEGMEGDVLFGCFTGKAAHVLRRKGCPNARTIHSLIYKPTEQSKEKIISLEKALALENDLDKKVVLERQIREEREALKELKFVLNEDSDLLRAKLLVLDECSMITEKMGKDLISFGCPILVLGDPAQLPPVKSKGGTGYFTKGEPDVLLQTIHRQALESGIIRFATAIRTGLQWRREDFGPDVQIMDAETFAQEVRPRVVPPVQTIVGINVTRRRANAVIRENMGMTSPLPEEGDRLICLRNNHDKGLLNGAQFTLLSMSHTRSGHLSLEVRDDDGWETFVEAHREPFEGEEVHWQRDKEAESFDFGAAVTCHKAQGSEWDEVVVVDESKKFKPHARAWAYTACTRAVRKLIWVTT